jgi:hypothetical protein
MWIDSIDDAVAVSLSDCVCTCMKHIRTAVQKCMLVPGWVEEILCQRCHNNNNLDNPEGTLQLVRVTSIK